MQIESISKPLEQIIISLVLIVSLQAVYGQVQNPEFVNHRRTSHNG